MTNKCFLHRVSTEAVWYLYQSALITRGYRIQIARDRQVLEKVYLLRREVYAAQGYLAVNIDSSQGFNDEVDAISVNWLLQWRGRPVGTVRATPLRYGRATIFHYLQGVEEILGERRNASVEIGRLGLLQSHRGSFLAIGLLLAAYRWALENGFQYLVWGGGSWLYRWLQRMVPRTEVSEASVTKYGLKELGGYFQKYTPRVYVVPICDIQLMAVGKHLASHFV